MRFESRLAERISAKKDTCRSWKTYAGLVGVIFIVLTLTASTTAVPQAVVHVGTQNSVAKYLGQFDGRTNVIMLGLTGVEDWISIKIPFKGHISDLESISFSEFVAQTGGSELLEPHVVLRLPEGKSLVWHPESQQIAGVYSLPYFSWVSKDAASQGNWAVAPAETQSLLVPLDTWTGIIGDPDVLNIYVFIGKWGVSDPYQCYLGDLAVNGKTVDLANAGRLSGPSKDLPPGF